jgi:DNA-binding NarL/FixJ family response regulator
MTMLIVEDDPVFLRIMKEIVSSGFPSVRLVGAASGEEAMAQFETAGPRLIFMDISLRDTNGLKLTKTMKERSPDIMVVIVTNHDTPEHREAAYEAGADSFISKSSNLAREVHSSVKSLAPWAYDNHNNSSDHA